MKAFPTHSINVNDEARVTAIGGESGMDLRDYFAGQVMQTMEWYFYAEVELNELQLKSEAKRCYKIADAMMEARRE
jgi:hypothetical protein